MFHLEFLIQRDIRAYTKIQRRICIFYPWDRTRIKIRDSSDN